MSDGFHHTYQRNLLRTFDFVVPAFVSKLDILANDWADEHAGKAAHSAEVPLNF